MFGRKTKLSTVVSREAIKEALSRGVEEVVGIDDLNEKLLSGTPLRIKFGVDPTSPKIHFGRATQLLKLRDFQKLGHKIIFIIGDATGVIGDTSDKESERPMLGIDEIDKNARDYFTQAGAVLDMSKVEKHHNSKWLQKLSYKDIGEQANQFSLADFIARDNIKSRLEKGKRVSLREVLYPLMQAYDSVATCADVELGGTDQRFNVLAGRSLQPLFKQKPQSVIMTPLIEGLDGRKMSSSWGNTINIDDTASDMYGKIMSLKDEFMEKYFITLTRIPLDEVKDLLKNNPRDTKMRLAKEIVHIFHGKEKAEDAEKIFISTFQKKEIPDNIKEVAFPSGTHLVDVLMQEGIVSSKSEFRRLIGEGAITLLPTGEVVKDFDFEIKKKMLVKIGKRRFLCISLT